VAFIAKTTSSWRQCIIEVTKLAQWISTSIHINLKIMIINESLINSSKSIGMRELIDSLVFHILISSRYVKEKVLSSRVID
jgi:hypothetical protein